jgi:hypothetical protein
MILANADKKFESADRPLIAKAPVACDGVWKMQLDPTFPRHVAELNTSGCSQVCRVGRVQACHHVLLQELPVVSDVDCILAIVELTCADTTQKLLSFSPYRIGGLCIR